MSAILDLIKARINALFAGKEPWQIARDTAIAIGVCSVLCRLYKVVRKRGLKATILNLFIQVASKLPATNNLIAKEKEKIANDLRHMLIPKEVASEPINYTLPEQGLPADQLLSKLKTWAAYEEGVWAKGKASGAIYHGGRELLETLTKAYAYFALSNPLHPDLFPYVRKMESEVVRMTCSLFNGDSETCGFMTSGGTESILMAVKAYRDKAYAERGVTEPELIACTTAHAAFEKACAYFRIKLVNIPAHETTQEIDVLKVAAAINKSTIAIVGSAPTFPHGVVDPIPRLAALAQRHNIGLHVDCCLGSFCIPFAEEHKRSIPQFDFRVAGVTSISADTHKFGYAPKGSSVIMFRNEALRRYMYFVTTTWPGGIYASPTITGSRPGALVAATWAALMTIGRVGYSQAAKQILDAADTIRAGIREIEGLEVVGSISSKLFVVAFGVKPEYRKKLDIYKIAQAMSKLGKWNLNSLQAPPCVHICVTYANKDNANLFVSDLRNAVQQVANNPDEYKGGTAQIYGVAESLGASTSSDEAGQSTGLVADMAKLYIDTLTYLPPKPKST